MEEKKAKGILSSSSSGREEDMIRKLPDSLISQILSYLPRKEAVRTSVLSNMWKSLWLLIPGLYLDSAEFPDYNASASFIGRCLAFSREEKSCLHKLKLSIHKGENDNQSCLTRWIDFVATARNLKDLDVECFVKRKCLEVMPVSLFSCETLLHLRLCRVLFSSSFEDSLSFSLPRLKTMHLELNVYASDTSLESLISSCRVLEDLSIIRREDDNNVKVLGVCSQTLTSLSIKNTPVRDGGDGGKFGVLIDAPRLKYLNLEDEISASKTITNSGSLTKVNILGIFYLERGNDQVRKFFTSFSGVRDLKISMQTFLYIIEMVPLPQFCNLSYLEADLVIWNLEKLPTLLAICPNLRSLILNLTEPRAQLRLSSVPLEFVEIKCKYRRYLIVELVRYFAQNSVILKKIVLRLRSSTLERNSILLGDLLALPRRSSTCEIIVC